VKSLNSEYKSVEAIACANIALVKYWGKRNHILNLPAVGSISITLKALQTKTKVLFRPDLEKDILRINEQNATDQQQQRVRKFLDIIRNKYSVNHFAEVNSINNFPTSAGLASSASAFAAISLASTGALDLSLSKSQLSVLARRGSGSAARSIYGGYVEMIIGTDPQGNDDYAVQLETENYWDLRVIILITAKEQKSIGSTAAMNSCADTSIYYQPWVDSSVSDLREMRNAIQKKDLEKLGEMAELSALKMHALILSAKPAIIYWNSTTIQLIHMIRKLRQEGIPAYFTIDAGPQIKVITLPGYVSKLVKEFKGIPEIQEIIETAIGPDAGLIGVFQ
jgi:diphosphomevalonate decarboxylase